MDETSTLPAFTAELESWRKDLLLENVQQAARMAIAQFPRGFDGDAMTVLRKACERTHKALCESRIRDDDHRRSFFLKAIRDMAKDPKIAAPKEKTSEAHAWREQERERIRREARERGEELVPAEVEALVGVDTTKPRYRRMKALEDWRRARALNRDPPFPWWAHYGYDSDAEYQTALTGGYKGHKRENGPPPQANLFAPDPGFLRPIKRGELIDGDIPTIGDALDNTQVGDDLEWPNTKPADEPPADDESW